VNSKGTIRPVIGIEIYGGVKLGLHAFLSLELNPCRFTPGKIASGSHGVGSGRILDTSEKKKSSLVFS